MIRHPSALLLSALALATAPATASALGRASVARDDEPRSTTVRVAGVVLDADGRPVPEAKLSTYWFQDAGKPRPTNRIETDGEGRFDGAVQLWEPAFALVAYAREGGRAGIVELEVPGGLAQRDSEARIDGISIRLAPTVRVRGRIVSPDLGAEIPWTSVDWALASSKREIARCKSEEATFDLQLPPGRYRWTAYGGDLAETSGELALEAGEKERDLGEIRVPAAYLALNRGRPLAEWTVTDARGVERDKCALADYRGKWCLVAFWSVDSAPSAMALADLIDFSHEKPDRCALIAFHDPSVKSAAELDQRIDALARKHWRGRKIPFPVLIDASGKTFERYGIPTLPTILLIDPEGNLVGESDVDGLRKALAGPDKK